MSNYIHYKAWDETPYPVPNLNGEDGMDKKLHPTFYWANDYISMLGLNLNHVSKRGLRS